MSKPMCCGKPCQPVKQTFGRYGYYWICNRGFKWVAGSVMLYFRCRVCGHNGVPYSTTKNTSYMDSLAAIREEGLKFDATFI